MLWITFFFQRYFIFYYALIARTLEHIVANREVKCHEWEIAKVKEIIEKLNAKKSMS